MNQEDTANRFCDHILALAHLSQTIGGNVLRIKVNVRMYDALRAHLASHQCSVEKGVPGLRVYGVIVEPE